jgi:hypothetical protein
VGVGLGGLSLLLSCHMLGARLSMLSSVQYETLKLLVLN